MPPVSSGSLRQGLRQEPTKPVEHVTSLIDVGELRYRGTRDLEADWEVVREDGEELVQR
jgi:hypothetical protein